jgi:hypothetical protein
VQPFIQKKLNGCGPLFKKPGPFFFENIKISSNIYMYYSFTVLLEHDCDAYLMEECMTKSSIGYECEVIGDDYLIYEFTINDEHRIAVELIIAYNNITVLKFLSKYN